MVIDSQGYPAQGRKRMHTRVVEAALGKPLPPKAEVHHVNENKLDYSNSNLVICQDRAYHMLLHYRTAALDATGNADAIKCSYCQQWDVRSNPNMCDRSNNRRQKYWHRSCFQKAQRETWRPRRIAKFKAGLCYTCSAPKENKALHTCQRCRDRRNAALRAKRRSNV